MYSTGMTEKNKSEKRLSEYNHYAKKSLVFGIIVLSLVLLFWFSGYLVELLVRSNFNKEIVNFIFLITFLLLLIAVVVLAILGIIFGKKGLKSNKAGMSIAGLVLSIIGLSIPSLGIIILLIYILAGGEIM